MNQILESASSQKERGNSMENSWEYDGIIMEILWEYDGNMKKNMINHSLWVATFFYAGNIMVL